MNYCYSGTMVQQLVSLRDRQKTQDSASVQRVEMNNWMLYTVKCTEIDFDSTAKDDQSFNPMNHKECYISSKTDF